MLGRAKPNNEAYVNIKRNLLALVFAAALCAGCVNKTGVAEQASTSGALKSDFTLRGRVGLGSASGVEVRAFVASDDELLASEPIGFARTDESGSYSIKLSSRYLGENIVLRAVVLSGQSNVRCVVISGCKAIDFEKIMLAPSSWTLNSYVGHATGNGQFNISLLTDLAYYVSFDGSDGAGLPSNPLHYKKVQSSISGRFGLVGDFVQQPLINVVDKTELNAFDTRYIRSSALDVSIVRALGDSLPDVPIAQLINIFKVGYDVSGIANLPNENQIFSLAAVYDEMIEVLDKYKNEVNQLAVLITQLQAAKYLFLVEESDRSTSGVSSPNVELSPVARVKAFVADIRQIAGSIELPKLTLFNDISSLVGGDLKSIFKALGVEIDADVLLSNESSKEVFEGLLIVGKSLISAFGVSIVDVSVTQHMSEENVLVMIDVIDNQHRRMMIEQVIDVCDEDRPSCKVNVNLELFIGVRSVCCNPELGEFLLKDVNLKLIGSLSNEKSELRFLEQNQQVVFGLLSLVVDNTLFSMAEESSYDFALENTNFALPFSLSREIDGGFYNLDSVVTGQFKNFAGEYRNYINKSAVAGGWYSLVERSEFHITRLDRGDYLNLAAKIESPDLVGFNTSITFRKDDYPYAGNATYLSQSSSDCNFNTGYCDVLDESSGMVGESEHSFLGLDAVAIYRANLKGIREPVLMELGIARETHTKNKLRHINVSYPGHSFLLKGEFTSSGSVYKLDAESLDGVKMSIDQPGGVNTNRTGWVKDFDGTIVADIEDMGKWIKISFEGGDFVSM